MEKRIWKNIYICICIPDLLSCTLETNHAVNYASIKKENKEYQTLGGLQRTSTRSAPICEQRVDRESRRGERDGDSKQAFSSAAPPSVFSPIPAPQSSPRAGDGGPQPRGKAERDSEGRPISRVAWGPAPETGVPVADPPPCPRSLGRPGMGRTRSRVLWSWALARRRWAPWALSSPGPSLMLCPWLSRRRAFCWPLTWFMRKQ